MNRPGLRRKILVTSGLSLLWALVVIAVVFAEAMWFSQPAVRRGDFASIENHLVQKLRAATASKKLGSAALVLVQGGKIAAEHGFGVANVETKAPVKTDQTMFILGSVSKAVTAWGVMKLVEEGKLGLDEPVIRYLKRWRFPGSEAYRDKVTARHLLSHTAGIDDGFRAASFAPGEIVQALEESLTHPKDMDGGERTGVLVVREPGTTMSYSASAGNSILQLLIEEITNRRFADYMKEAVLQPLGMTKSSYDLDAITAEGRLPDLAPGFDGNLKPHPPRRYTAQAAVALRVTPRDLAQFALAYTRENPVLKPETLKQMMTPQPATAGTWGLGQTLYVANEAGGYVVGHSGAAFPAQGASLRVNPATGNGFVLTVSGGRGATNQLVHDWVFWETGQVTSEARQELAYARLRPALIAIVVGAGILLLGQFLYRINKQRHFMKAFFTLATVLFLFLCQNVMPSGMAALEEPTAFLQTTAKPSAANHMIYDAQRRQIILLTCPRQAEREEVWGWDGKQWRFIPSSGPTARELSAAAYDVRRKRLVLHGGMGLANREDRRSDTWEWDGKNWHQMTDTSVGTRDHHAMAYDEARGKTVLFGGVKTDDRLAMDTWEWDGVKWTQAALQGPGGRAHFALVYDSRRKQVVLFGGLGEGYKKHNDTWAWEGKTWRKLSEEGPPRRTHHRMAFDDKTGVIVLFGGLAGGDPKAALDDTWIWDGQQWKEIKTTGPARRSGHVMAYDAARGKIVLSGGGSWDGKISTNYDDFWEWDGKNWTQAK